MTRILIIVLLFAAGATATAQNLDIKILREINLHRDKGLDPTFKFLTNSASPVSLAVPIGFVAYAIVSKDSVHRFHAVSVFSGMVVNGILTIAVKQLANRTRPFQTYPDLDKQARGGGPSFPSGHTSAAFAVATSVSIAYPKWYVIAPSYLWATAVGYSRMDLGVHYPTDVLAGAIIGSGSAYLSYRVNKWVQKRHSARRKFRRTSAASSENLHNP